MEPTRPASPIQEIKTKEFEAIFKRNEISKLYTNHDVIVKQWKTAKQTIKEHKKKHSENKLQYGKVIELRKELFKARYNKLARLPINEEDIEAEKAWREGEEYKKKITLEKTSKIKDQLISSNQAIRIAEAALNDQIDEIAKKYIHFNKVPSETNPLFSEIKLRMAFVRSQNYQSLSKEELAVLDKEFEPLLKALYQDSLAVRSTSPCASVLKLIDLFNTSPSYAMYRLSTFGGVQATKVVNMIMNELLGTPFIAKLAKAAVAFEIKDKLPDVLLRGESFNEKIISEFQRVSLSPILRNLVNSIRTLVKDKDLEIDPTKNTTSVESNQEKIMGFITLSLKKIHQFIIDKHKGIPIDLKELYRMIYQEKGVLPVASLFFLRYLGPELTVKRNDDTALLNRNLVLISKILNSLVNNQIPAGSTQFIGTLPLKREPETIEFDKGKFRSPTLMEVSQEPISAIARNLTVTPPEKEIPKS